MAETLSCNYRVVRVKFGDRSGREDRVVRWIAAILGAVACLLAVAAVDVRPVAGRGDVLLLVARIAFVPTGEVTHAPLLWSARVLILIALALPVSSSRLRQKRAQTRFRTRHSGNPAVRSRKL